MPKVSKIQRCQAYCDLVQALKLMLVIMDWRIMQQEQGQT